MQNRYYEGEKSVGLVPIALGVGAVAMIAFGLLFYTCGKQVGEDLKPGTPTSSLSQSMHS